MYHFQQTTTRPLQQFAPKHGWLEWDFGLFSEQTGLVGGFNSSEKYSSNWIISPNRAENKIYLKPPPSNKLPTENPIEIGQKTVTQNHHPFDGHEFAEMPVRQKMVKSSGSSSTLGPMRPQKNMEGILLIGGFSPTHLKTICSSKWVHLPQIFGVKIKQSLSCHHLVLDGLQMKHDGTLWTHIWKCVLFFLMNYYLITPPKKTYQLIIAKGDGFVESRGGVLLTKHRTEIPKLIGVLHVHGYICTTREDLSSPGSVKIDSGEPFLVG